MIAAYAFMRKAKKRKAGVSLFMETTPASLWVEELSYLAQPGKRPTNLAGRFVVGRVMEGWARPISLRRCYEHPVVLPQVLHLRQVPLRTRVKLPHSEQLSPS